MKFRDLKPDEIDVRVGTVSEKGVSLLLYKDARVDMNILDETVGAENWQRFHSRDNANCIIQIWDEDKHQWVSKEDTGTESNTEKEKGLASDSFKRARHKLAEFGRELYTSPFIWLPADKVTLYDTGRKDPRGNIIYGVKDKFYVLEIDIKDKVITGLEIYNQKGTRVFNFKNGKEVKETK